MNVFFASSIYSILFPVLSFAVQFSLCVPYGHSCVCVLIRFPRCVCLPVLCKVCVSVSMLTDFLFCLVFCISSASLVLFPVISVSCPSIRFLFPLYLVCLYYLHFPVPFVELSPHAACFLRFPDSRSVSLLNDSSYKAALEALMPPAEKRFQLLTVAFYSNQYRRK